MKFRELSLETSCVTAYNNRCVVYAINRGVWFCEHKGSKKCRDPSYNWAYSLGAPISRRHIGNKINIQPTATSKPSCVWLQALCQLYSRQQLSCLAALPEAAQLILIYLDTFTGCIFWKRIMRITIMRPRHLLSPGSLNQERWEVREYRWGK